MIRFIREQDGNAVIFSAFLIIILIIITLFVMTGDIIYTQYNDISEKLERTISTSVTEVLADSDIRDLVLDIPQDFIITVVENNLSEQMGLIKSGADWVCLKNGKETYRLTELNMQVNEDIIQAEAKLKIRLPWVINSNITIPVRAAAKILYLN